MPLDPLVEEGGEAVDVAAPVRGRDVRARVGGSAITIPGAEEVIDMLGGAELMVKIRTVKTATATTNWRSN